MKKLFIFPLLFFITSTIFTQGYASTEQVLKLENMVYVPSGTFQMGTKIGGQSDERPVHTVTLSGFYMGIYEVTQKEYMEITGTNPSRFLGNNLPVESVSWFDAISFCNIKSKKEGLTSVYNIEETKNGIIVTWVQDANGYRLPTEAEWEYAARGGYGSPENYIFSGSNNASEVAWFKDNSNGNTNEVGTKNANIFGIHDLTGNVWEWCWDWYGRYNEVAKTNPTGASTGSSRISRGGSWASSIYNINSTYQIRSTKRGYDFPTVVSAYQGFRVVRNDINIIHENTTEEVESNTLIDSEKLLFGINANAGGLIPLGAIKSSGPSINLEFLKGNFLSIINLNVSIENEKNFGFGFSGLFNYLWKSKIGDFYLGGGLGYLFQEDHYFTFGANVGYRYITSFGMYFNIGGYIGGKISNSFILDIRPVVGAGYNF